MLMISVAYCKILVVDFCGLGAWAPCPRGPVPRVGLRALGPGSADPPGPAPLGPGPFRPGLLSALGPRPLRDPARLFPQAVGLPC